MATSTELLRAAVHMRQESDSAFKAASNTMSNRNLVVRGASYSKAADALEAEAARLRFAEARQPKRSWPEGWPPFAVLRRAYHGIGVHHAPSTRWCDSKSPVVARRTRERWKQALDVLRRPPSP